jgi:hypothetical protein
VLKHQSDELDCPRVVVCTTILLPIFTLLKRGGTKNKNILGRGGSHTCKKWVIGCRWWWLVSNQKRETKYFCRRKRPRSVAAVGGRVFARKHCKKGDVMSPI